MPLPFLSETTKKLLQKSRAKYYDDTLSLRYLSGSSIADPSSLRPVFTTPNGAEVEDAFGRPDVNASKFKVVSGEVLIPGSFAWAPTMDRRFLPLGMQEDAEALFACSDEFYPYFSGSHTFVIREGKQLEIEKVTTDLTTNEIYVVLKRSREDDTGDTT